MDTYLRHDIDYLWDVVKGNRTYTPITFKHPEFGELITRIYEQHTEVVDALKEKNKRLQSAIVKANEIEGELGYVHDNLKGLIENLKEA